MTGKNQDLEHKAGPEAGADAASAAGAPPESLSPTEALAQAEALSQENWNKYLRAVAELDNVRKRSAREVEQARKFGMERFASEVLPVLDSLEMGLEAGASATVDTLLEGKKATLRLLRSVLQKFGVEEIAPAGEVFNPQLHEAISIQTAPGAEAGSVVAVIQKGYQLNGRLLRPARVVVAGTPAEAAPAAEDPGNQAGAA